MEKPVGGPERVTLFDDLGVYKILATAGDTSAMERFAAEWLGPLIDYDSVRSRADRAGPRSSRLICASWRDRRT
jgi:hypothetical protein